MDQNLFRDNRAVRPALKLSQLLLYRHNREITPVAEQLNIPGEQIIRKVIENSSNFFRSVNTLARMREHVGKYGKADQNWQGVVQFVTRLIVKIYQQDNIEYCRKFRGAGLTVQYKDELFWCVGRTTSSGRVELLLIPPHNTLHRLLTGSLHRLAHRSAAAERHRSMMEYRFYIVQASKCLQREVNSCGLCRRRKRKALLYSEMGALPAYRVDPVNTKPWQYCIADCAGPLWARERRYGVKTKVYFLVVACELTRAALICVLPDLKADSICKGFDIIFSRVGRCNLIKTDFAASFVRAGRDIDSREGMGEEILLEGTRNQMKKQAEINAQTLQDEKQITEQIKVVMQTMKSRNVTISQRQPRAAWYQAGAERAIGSLKQTARAVQGLGARSFFQWIHTASVLESCFNSRPLGQTSGLETLTPLSFDPNRNKNNFTGDLSQYLELQDQTTQRWVESWFQFYWQSAVALNKWAQKNHSLKIGDVCLDLTSREKVTSYPRLCQIINTKVDTSGQERYFTVEYTLDGKRKSFDRVAQHLLVVLPAERRLDLLGDEVLGAAPPGGEGDEPGPGRDAAGATDAQGVLNQPRPVAVGPVRATDDGALESAEMEQEAAMPAVLLPGEGDRQADGAADDAHLLPVGDDGVDAEPAVHSRTVGGAGEVTAAAVESGAASNPDLGTGNEGEAEPGLVDVQQDGQVEPVVGRPDDQLQGSLAGELGGPAAVSHLNHHLTDQAPTAITDTDTPVEDIPVATAGNMDTAVLTPQPSVDAGNDVQRQAGQPRRTNRQRKFNPRFK